MKLITRALNKRKAEEGELCPQCKGALLVSKQIERTFDHSLEHYGGGYAGASSFKAGLPQERVYKIISQIICPTCGFQGRRTTGYEHEPEG